jgi:DNA-binding transcriptional ArsR family regulator
MLNIINNLQPFFKDCYRRISVREYAKIINVSPPTASILLSSLEKEGLLLKEKDRNYLFFSANKESKSFIDLSKIYWREILSPLLLHLDSILLNPGIILFGSLSKAEVNENSDVDLAVLSKKKSINLEKFENSLKRKIQFFWFDSIDNIKDKNLKNSVLNGYILKGSIK